MDYNVSSGESSNGIILENNSMTVFDGGTANNTTINSGGCLDISRGGVAKSTTVNSGGCLYVRSGGTASIIEWTPCEGYVSIDNGAYVTFAKSLYGVYYGSTGQLLSHAKVMTSKYVNYIGYKDEDEICESMFVMSGGTTNSTTIAGAYIKVWSGGTAINTIINARNGHEEEFGWGGYLHVSSGGTAKNTTLNNGWLSVHSGGKASKVVINDFGELEVYYGGKADGIILNAGGNCQVDGGTVTIAKWTPCEGRISIDDGGGMVIFSKKYSGVYIGANKKLQSQTKLATSICLGNDDMMVVMSGGTANNTSCCGGLIQIWSKGRANNTILSRNGDDWGGRLDVYSGGVASQTKISSPEAYMYVCNGGKAIETTIHGGYLGIYSGGIASNTTICEDHTYMDVWGNTIEVGTGGMAINTMLNDGGSLYVQSGGIVTNITLETGSYLYVASGGMVGGITNLGGSLDAENGAILNYIDDGWNGWLYDVKGNKVHTEITDSEPVKISSEKRDIQMDAEVFSYKDKQGNMYSNYVGYGDTVDFIKIHLDNAAKLSFTINATGAAKVTIWKLDEKWKKEILFYSQKSLQSTKLTLNKKTGVYSANTKKLLLDDGEYYISVESNFADEDSATFFNIEIDHDKSTFFDRGYNGDDWIDMKRDGDTCNEFGDIGTFNKNTKSIIEGEWVGYGDDVDYTRIHLDETVKLSFLLDATDATKFTIYKLNKTVRKGVVSYSLKSLQSTTLKKQKGGQYAATTKSLLLKEGDYYIAMKSTNAKKGGNAEYNILVNEKDTVFFSDADGGGNNWLYDKKNNELNDEIAYGEPIEISPSTKRVRVDTEAVNFEDANGTTWDNYVGYGDEYDFAKVRLKSDAMLKITITATDAVKFTAYDILQNVDSWTGIVSYTLETIQSSTLKKAKGDSLYRYSVTMMVPGNISFFVSMQSTNAAKGGCAYYNVEINQSSFEDYYYGALSCPPEEDNADALTRTDVLSFGQYCEDNTTLAAPSDYTSERIFEGLDTGMLASL